MRNFLEPKFTPADLNMIQAALDEWCGLNNVEAHPDRELAAAIMITLYREGYRSAERLLAAAAMHKGLRDLAHSAEASNTPS